MKKKRIVAAIMAASVMAGAFAGCQNAQTEEITESSLVLETDGTGDNIIVESSATTEATTTVVETEPEDEFNPRPVVEPLLVDEGGEEILHVRKMRHYNEITDDEGRYCGFVDYNTLELVDNDANTYSELNSGLQLVSEELESDCLASADERKEYDADIYCKNAQGGVLSFLVEINTEDGLTLKGYNLDTATGEIIALEDIFDDVDEVIDYVTSVDSTIDADEPCWTIDAEGVSFYGEDVVFVQFNTHGLGDGYISEDNGYVMELTGHTAYADVDNDGECEDIKVIPYFDDYYNSIDIVFDGITYSFDGYFGKKVQSYLIYNEGKYAIYVSEVGDDFVENVHVFYLDPIAVIDSGYVRGGVDATYIKGQAIINKTLIYYFPLHDWKHVSIDCMTDPNHFYMIDVYTNFGPYMYFATSEYSATGTDLLPERITDTTCVSHPMFLTAKKDIVGYDEEGDKVLVVAGQDIVFMGIINNDALAFRVREDGSLFYVKVELGQGTDFPEIFYIDGEPSDEVLEGFAAFYF